MSAPEAEGVAAERAATSSPIGVSSRQVFFVACVLLAIYAIYGGFLMIRGGGDGGERAAFGQSTINLAMLAAGFYLGSSASSRNKDHRP